MAMDVELNSEILDALHAAGENPLRVVDPQTNRAFVIIDEETHQQAMEALRKSQDRDSIARGVAEMNAGEGRSVGEAIEDIRGRLEADFGK